MRDAILIRTEERADAAGVVALAYEVNPDSFFSLAAYLHRFNSSPERARLARWVTVEDGRVVGSASVGLNWFTATAGAAWAGITVSLAHRRQGLGVRLAARQPVEIPGYRGVPLARPA